MVMVTKLDRYERQREREHIRMTQGSKVHAAPSTRKYPQMPRFRERHDMTRIDGELGWLSEVS